MTGTIKSVKDRGFGFIVRDDTGASVFFHAGGLQGGLEFDETLVERRVRFELEDSDRGPRAINIQPAE